VVNVSTGWKNALSPRRTVIPPNAIDGGRAMPPMPTHKHPQITFKNLFLYPIGIV